MKSVIFLAVLGATTATAGVIKEHGWTIEVWDDDTVTATVLSGGKGDSLAKICMVSEQKCLIAATTGKPCGEGDTYHGVMNADAGAIAFTANCVGPKGHTFMALTPYEDVDFVLRSSNKATIAIPSQSGGFEVTEFNVEGYNVASAKIELAAKRAKEQPGRGIVID